MRWHHDCRGRGAPRVEPAPSLADRHSRLYQAPASSEQKSRGQECPRWVAPESYLPPRGISIAQITAHLKDQAAKEFRIRATANASSPTRSAEAVSSLCRDQDVHMCPVTDLHAQSDDTSVCLAGYQ